MTVTHRDPAIDDISTRAAALHRDVEITPEFARALARMEDGVQPMFLTGRAGTGKSTLLRCFRDATKRNVAIVAPTGVAAINVGGQTIHSFFRFAPTPISSQEIRRSKNIAMYKKLHTLVIDEISMVRADMLDGIDQFLRINGPDRKQPFGGVRLIMVGDLFQLPPVVSTAVEKEYINNRYGTPYFFASEALSISGIESVELDTVFRQTDANFIRLLNTIRNCSAGHPELQELNARCFPDFSPPPDEAWIALTGTNAAADHINRVHLRQLRTREYTFQGEPSGKFERISERNYPAPLGLTLREGAQVMFIRNDPDRRWVNGTMGIVRSLGKDEIEVEVGGPGGPTEYVEKEEWEMYEYAFDADKNQLEAKVAGTYRQYPLRPAYAITIHKSQGKTFERAVVDLGRGAFAHGQTYVALSRLVDLRGLVLKRPLRARDLIVDPAVAHFSR